MKHAIQQVYLQLCIMLKHAYACIDPLPVDEMHLNINTPMEVELPDGSCAIKTLPRSRAVRGTSQLEGYHARCLNPLIGATTVNPDRAELSRIISNGRWNLRMGVLNRSDHDHHSDDRPLLEAIHRLTIAQGSSEPFPLPHGYLLPDPCTPAKILALTGMANATCKLFECYVMM
jgi:hypothetical protein